MSTKETSSANAELRAWYLRRLRPRLALAARERGISAAQAAALDQTMRELLGLHAPDAATSARSRPLVRLRNGAFGQHDPVGRKDDEPATPSPRI
jgi:hypothetical protein